LVVEHKTEEKSVIVEVESKESNFQDSEIQEELERVMQLTVVHLKKGLKKLDLSTKGLKAELCQRLAEAIVKQRHEENTLQQTKLAQETIEQDKQLQELEKERIRLEIEKSKIENEKIEFERVEQERLEQERLEKRKIRKRKSRARKS